MRSQINDVTESVAKLRAEAEVTKRREETIALDASRRKEEQCEHSRLSESAYTMFSGSKLQWRLMRGNENFREEEYVG